MGNTSVTVFYDDRCYFCCQLGKFLTTKTDDRLNVISVSEAAQSLANLPADPRKALTLRHGERWLQGYEAWKFLINYLPNLNGLAWLAEKAGLVNGKKTTTGTRRNWLKNRCHSC